MNRHFFNFIAMFNFAAKTGKWTFTIPLRNKFILTFLEYLLREGLIESYHFRDKVPNWSGCAAVLLSRKGGNYYVPVVIHLRQTKVLKGIKSVSTPGKYRYLNYRDLLIFTQKNAGAGAVVIMSSSYFGRLCTAKELLAVGQGGLVLCVVET